MAGVDGSLPEAGGRRIAVIVTEHPDYVSASQRQEVAGLAEKVSRIAGAEVTVSHYLDSSDLYSSDLEGVAALVLTGSHAPWSAHDDDDLAAFGDGVKAFGGPVFGICAGMQLLARFEGAAFRRCREEERGFTTVALDTGSQLFADLPAEVEVYQHHTDEVTSLPPSVRVLARNEACSVQALAVEGRPWWGTQFHPELADEAHPAGLRILERAVRRLLDGDAGRSSARTTKEATA